MQHQLSKRLLGRAVSLGSRFARGESGVAAIEFAMVLPFLLIAYIGTVELAQGIVLSRKISVVERNLADITSQEQAAIGNARMDAIFTAARGALAPYDGSKLRMTVTSVQLVNGAPQVIWSETLSGADARTQGYAPGAPPFTVPAGLLPANGDSTIMAEAVYDFEPLMNYMFEANIKLTGSQTGRIFMRPRSMSAIARNRAA